MIFPVSFTILIGSFLLCLWCIWLENNRRRRTASSPLFVIDEESSIVLSGTYIDQFYMMPVKKDKEKNHIA